MASSLAAAGVACGFGRGPEAGQPSRRIQASEKASPIRIPVNNQTQAGMLGLA